MGIKDRLLMAIVHQYALKTLKFAKNTFLTSSYTLCTWQFCQLYVHMYYREGIGCTHRYVPSVMSMIGDDPYVMELRTSDYISSVSYQLSVHHCQKSIPDPLEKCPRYSMDAPKENI